MEADCFLSLSDCRMNLSMHTCGCVLETISSHLKLNVSRMNLQDTTSLQNIWNHEVPIHISIHLFNMRMDGFLKVYVTALFLRRIESVTYPT